MAELQHLPDIEVSKDDPDEGIRSLLQILRPEWQWENVQKKVLQGGFINSMTHVFLPSQPPAEGLVFRVFGNKLGDVEFNMMDREKEIIGLQLAAKAGCGATIYAAFKNGLVLGFLEGRNVELEDFTNPKVNCLIAKAIAQIHVMDPESFTTLSGKPSPFDISKDMDKQINHFEGAAKSIPESLPNPEDTKRFKEANMLCREDMIKEWEFVKDTFFGLNFPRTFSHKDAHGRNMIYNEKEQHAYFVDFEMTGYDHECRDVACVFAGAEFWPMFPDLLGQVDETIIEKLKDTEVVEGFVRSYLEAKAELQGTTVKEDDVTEMNLAVAMSRVISDFGMMLFAPMMVMANMGFDALKVGLKGRENYFSKKDSLIKMAMEYKEFTEKRQT